MKKIKLLNPIPLVLSYESQIEKVEQAEHQVKQQMLDALTNFDQGQAREHFKLLLEWNTLRKSIRSLLNSLVNDCYLTFVTSVWFLQDLLAHLTPRTDEELVYITGPTMGGVQVLSRICGFELEEQSAVYARGTAKGCSDALIEMLEHGNSLHALGHSHPGAGLGATHESSIDTGYLGKIQRNGANAIGLIFTRDGYVRFFSVEKPFQVFVVGKEIEQIDEYVYKIIPHEKNQNQKAPAVRRWFC